MVFLRVAVLHRFYCITKNVKMIGQKCEDLVAVSRYITNVEMIRQKCEDLVAVSRYTHVLQMLR